MSNAISKLHFFPRRPQVKPKSFGGPARVILTTLAVFVLSQIIAGVIAGIALGIAGDSITDLNTSVPGQFIYILFAEGLAAGLVLLVLKERGLKLKAIGLGRRPRWSDLGRALLAFLVYFAALIVVSLVINRLAPSITNEKQDVGFKSLNTALESVMAFIALVILPPLGEETLVRGYLYSGLRSRLRYVPALLITSLLFGLAHLGGSDSGLLWSGAVDTFLLSVVLVYLRQSTGALYAGMLLHSLNNIIAFHYH